MNPIFEVARGHITGGLYHSSESINKAPKPIIPKEKAQRKHKPKPKHKK